jgi:ribosomal-protein-alanine N-acetyltransferase
MPSPPPPLLTTGRLALRVPGPGDEARLLAYAARNREHLARWEVSRPEAFFTEAHWRGEVARCRQVAAADLGLPLLLERREDPRGPVVGRCNLSNLVRGAFQAAHLGYSLDREAEGQGLMAEALRAVIAHAFGPMNLHRLMANFVPENERSARVLERLGFVREGLARDYLFIADAWRDHVLTSLVNPAWRPR